MFNKQIKNIQNNSGESSLDFQIWNYPQYYEHREKKLDNLKNFTFVSHQSGFVINEILFVEKNGQISLILKLNL